MDLKIREFKLTLENYISGCDLPPEIKRMVLKEIYESADRSASEAIAAEIKEREEQEGEQDEQSV